MKVHKVTLKDGFHWYDDHSEGFRERVHAAQRNRGVGLEVVEILEMTEDEYHAIPATSELQRSLGPEGKRESNDGK